jgi:hypothetical protein
MQKLPEHIRNAKELVYQFDTLTSAEKTYTEYLSKIQENISIITLKTRSENKKIIVTKYTVAEPQKLSEALKTLINDILKDIKKYIDVLSQPNPKVLNYSAVIPPFSQEKLIIISYKDNNHKNDLSFLETKIQNLILKYSTEIK